MSNIDGWKKRFSGYLFDLDGTLIDTAPDLMIALNHSLSTQGFPAVSEALTRHWVGHGAKVLIEQALEHHGVPLTADEASQTELDEMLEVFIDFYRTHSADHSQIYPDVEAVLQTLRENGAKLAVVTNKRADLTNPLIENIGLGHFFDLIISGDTAEKPKPSPEPVLLALETLKLQPRDTLFVGDSQTDVLAAKAAGTPVVCVRDGYNHGIDVTTLHPDGVIDGFTELLGWSTSD